MNGGQTKSFHDFIEHLVSSSSPFLLRKGLPPEWKDISLHQSIYQQNPILYGLLSLSEKALPEQRERILFQLLRSTWQHFGQEQRNILQRIVSFLCTILHPDQVLRVFLALRRERANYKHVRHTILRFILNHPQALDMSKRRRRAVVDAVEHALGKNVARACFRYLSSSDTEKQKYLRKNLLKYHSDPERVRKIFATLYRQKEEQNPSNENGTSYTETHQPLVKAFAFERPTTVTATNRGEIAAAIAHLYGNSPEKKEMYLQTIETAVAMEAERVPHYDGKVVCILDASASTRGYGEREFCCLSQSLALTKVLKKVCPNFTLLTVGGEGDFPEPKGTTDLAGPLITALETEPDLVMIISDGYENHHAGDLARVLATLKQMKIQTPIVFCHSKFSYADHLELRRPAPNIQEFSFWHQADFAELLLSLWIYVGKEDSLQAAQNYLLKKLSQWEEEF
ncbi:hypothetical protein [Thermoflavimicrobium dichotomicum]|nr:hypothetical protein [Thermoflavimicrobium dichotomicum]